ncbi:MAG: nucleotidyl transferase AbiEii/AbiGii toxin family protein [Candidatus Shapirobacteria bacterium]
MVKILKAIYEVPVLREGLGFKGGTAAVLFYGLPRISVDLDFNLLKPELKEKIWVKLNHLLPEIATVDEAREKRYTLFFLLSYGVGQRKVKIEISHRFMPAGFASANYLGISMPVMIPGDMMAGKLAALLTRKKFASRDLFDLWFFLKQDWQINEQFLQAQTGLTLPEALKKAAKITAKVPQKEILAGLGELLGPKQKAWAKEKLKEELLFQLALRQGEIGKRRESAHT